MHFPKHSPDLNALDYRIWADINRRMRLQEKTSISGCVSRRRIEAYCTADIHTVCPEGGDGHGTSLPSASPGEGLVL